jgi:hypothetical protein
LVSKLVATTGAGLFFVQNCNCVAALEPSELSFAPGCHLPAEVACRSSEARVVFARPGMTPRRNIELSELQKLFHLTEKQVAKELGVCLTSLKKICRQHGIHRWPYRKV